MKRNRSQAIVCRQDGKILLVKHKLFGRVFFTLPGGGIEDGETPAEAALRELKEEACVEGKILRPLTVEYKSVKLFSHLLFYPLTYQFFSGKPCFHPHFIQGPLQSLLCIAMVSLIFNIPHKTGKKLEQTCKKKHTREIRKVPCDIKPPKHNACLLFNMRMTLYLS